MKLTNKINKKTFNKPLDTHLCKTADEYTALATLKFCYGEKYKYLRHADAPDLQDVVNGIGIEVVNSISRQEARANGEMIKYYTLPTREQKEKCKKKIEEYMDEFDEHGALGPDRFLAHEKEEIVSAFVHKLEKVPKYSVNGFKKLGLLIYHPQCIFPETEALFASWRADIKKESCAKFDFVYILPNYSRCNRGILYYDFASGEVSSVKIAPEDRHTLSVLGRMAAEGEIKDNDPIWD